MKPYYEHAGITIYHGDARDLAGDLTAESVITDPVWPNCEHIFPGIDAALLLEQVLFELLPSRRVVVQLGCNSDPRFLLAVPKQWRYLRTCYLEYAVVGYLGRIMFKHWLRPAIAWSVAGTCLEMRAFCREHGIRREGNWLVGEIDEG